MPDKKMTKITIENEYVVVNINVNQTDMVITDLINELIKPALYSLGYDPELVDGCFTERALIQTRVKAHSSPIQG